MINRIAMCVTLFLLAARVSPAATIPGFEDPQVLEKVMAGTLTQNTVESASNMIHIVYRAFLPSVSPDLYVGVAANFEHYPDYMSDIKEGKTLSSNADHTELTFSLDYLLKLGFIKKQVQVEGTASYHKAPDAVSEATFNLGITNYTEYVSGGALNTRLIPYNGGILLYADLSATVLQGTVFMSTIRQKVGEGVNGMLAAFRTQLNHGE
jgi:hypothetical protein